MHSSFIFAFNFLHSCDTPSAHFLFKLVLFSNGMFPVLPQNLSWNQGKFLLFLLFMLLKKKLRSLCLVCFMFLSYERKWHHFSFRFPKAALRTFFFFSNCVFTQSSDYRTYTLHNAQADMWMVIMRNAVKVLSLFLVVSERSFLGHAGLGSFSRARQGRGCLVYRLTLSCT